MVWKKVVCDEGWLLWFAGSCFVCSIFVWYRSSMEETANKCWHPAKAQMGGISMMKAPVC